MANKRKDLKIEGSNLWYFVGLIVSDGCLSKDGRHINITTKDYGFLKEVKIFLGIKNKIGTKNKNKINKAYYLEFSNKNFYEFLLSKGLTPRKSLTQNKVAVPDEWFCDFLRGVIDGDGGIQRWAHSTNGKEQWSLRIASGSQKFLTWLQNKIEDIVKVKGKLYHQSKNLFRLKYGKIAAKVIARNCYYRGAVALKRKENLARACINSYKGWQRSKTILS